MSRRTPLSSKTRFEVFKRDNFTCQYCGSHPPEVVLHVDHIHPVSAGGSNDEENLITSCSLCNFGKGAALLSSSPKSIEEKAADLREREAQIAGYSALMAEIRDRLEDQMWQIAEEIKPGASNGYDRSRLASIKRFVKDLGIDECLDATEIAWAKKPYSETQRFKYFCGVCWRKLERKTEASP